MEVNANDIESSCRTCLQQSTNLKPLFETFYKEAPLAKILILITPELTIDKSDTRLSHLICECCRLSAINAYKFQQMCVDNDKRIRLLIQDQVKNDIKTEEATGEATQESLGMIEKIESPLGINLQDASNDVLLDELKPMEDNFDSDSPDQSNDDTDTDSSSESSESDIKLSCESCEKNFSTVEKLELHIKRNHEVRKSRSAGSEDIESSDNDEDDSEKIFTCDTCPKKFKKPSLLARHIKTHDPNKRPHECAKCQKRFPSQVALVRHDILHSELVERSKINSPEPQDFCCVVCGRLFKSPESLMSHLKSHKNKSEEDQEYTCKLCHDVFPTFTDIVRHSKNHIENATHQCAICNKLFVVGDELIDHFLRHKGMKPHQCPVCEKSFLKLHKLNVHMRIHSEDKVRFSI